MRINTILSYPMTSKFELEIIDFQSKQLNSFPGLFSCYSDIVSRRFLLQRRHDFKRQEKSSRFEVELNFERKGDRTCVSNQQYYADESFILMFNVIKPPDY